MMLHPSINTHSFFQHRFTIPIALFSCICNHLRLSSLSLSFIKRSSPAIHTQPWAYAAQLIYFYISATLLFHKPDFPTLLFFLYLTHGIFFLMLTLIPIRMLLMASGNLGICHLQLNIILGTLITQEILPAAYPSPVR